MKKRLIVSLSLCLFLLGATGARTAASSPRAATPTSRVPESVGPQASAPSQSKRRGPVFRATREQIKQAQAMLKQRGFYAGESTGRLDAETRAGLRKYQEAEGLKVTGTLNRVTLEKMSISLTDKQRAAPAI